MTFRKILSLGVLSIAALIGGCSAPAEITTHTIKTYELACCADSKKVVTTAISEYIKETSLFTPPTKNDDFGMVYHIETDSDILTGNNILILEYLNGYQTDGSIVGSAAVARIPFVVTSRDAGSFEINFFSNYEVSYSMVGKISLMAPKESIERDIERIALGGSVAVITKQVFSELRELKQGVSGCIVNHYSKLDVGIFESLDDNNISQSIMIIDTDGNRHHISQVVDNDNYEMIKNGEKVYLFTDKHGKKIVKKR